MARGGDGALHIHRAAAIEHAVAHLGGEGIGLPGVGVAHRHHAGNAGLGGGEGDDVWQWFRKSVRSSYSTLDKLVETWRKLIEERVPPEDRAMIIAALIKKMKVGGSIAEAIRARAIEHPPENSWDVYNLLTFATSHIIEAPQQVIRGQLVAADFTSEESHARTCPLCHRNR